MPESRGDRIGIVLQARMGSARLPGKVLMPLGDTNLLGWIVRRLEKLAWPLVVATTDRARDDSIARVCEKMGVQSFRGSEEDVLDRYYRCAVSCRFQHVVRLTSDNPFPDIDELKKLVSLHIDSNADYTHSFGELPIGVGSEIFRFEALQQAWREGHAAHHREHVNEYLIENTHKFRIRKLQVVSSKHAPDLRLTIDTEEDYRHVREWLENGIDVDVDTEALIRRCSSSA